jgi:hypothetical protein
MTVETEAKATPALFTHCQNVYKKMLEVAVPESEDPNWPTGADGESPNPPVEIMVYEGFISHLIRDLHLSTPNYTYCLRALKQMGCVRQLRRGGSTTPSRWQLISSPTEELFESIVNKGGRNSKPTDRVGMLQEQIQRLNAQHQALREQFDQFIAGYVEVHKGDKHG